MSISQKLSIKLTNFVKDNSSNLSEDKLAEIQYGLHSFFMNVYKFPILFILAYFCGVLKYTILSLLFFGIIRIFAFGIHLKNGWSCLLASIIAFIGIPLIALYVHMPIMFFHILFIFNSISICLYAPADTEKRPLINPTRRKRCKILSIIFVLFLYFIVVIKSSTILYTIVTLSIFCECIIILPITYKLLGQNYRNYLKYKK